MENTNPQGSESLNVNQAASAFENLMGDDDGASDSQPESQSEEYQASDEAQEYEEESEEIEQPKPRFKVKAAGEEIEVDQDELIKGYQQGVDYTKKSRCGNCAAFIQTPKMLACIESGLEMNGTEMDAWEVIDAGDLGYCEVFDFKCASKRTCEAWISGGPITEDDYDGNDKPTSDGNDAETYAEED